jgi:hypothetical protein
MRARLSLVGLVVIGSQAAFAHDEVAKQPTPEERRPEVLTPEHKKTTLIPVYDPRCGRPLPIVQKYREVSIEEAARGPDCLGPIVPFSDPPR